MGNDASMEIEIFGEGELEAEFSKHGGAGDISIKNLVEKSYNEVIRTVIRPQRARYQVEALGDGEFPLPRQVYETTTRRDAKASKADDESDEKDGGDGDTREVRRLDFAVENDRGLQLQCSHWQIFASAQATRPLVVPCLVYLHSNVGSRVDALRVRDIALARGFSVCAFDFSGSGQSDGIYVTCGWNESKDLHFVLQHLEEDASVESICFYAHSMGTFPAIVNVASRTLVKSKKIISKMDALPSYFRQANATLLAKPIKGMVLDGAYSKMAKVTEELMSAVQQEGFKVPLSLLKLACAVIQKSVKKRADVDLDDLRPVDFASACYIPALLIAGEQDRYVAPHHSEKLASKYGGPAVIMKVEGEHYTRRTQEIYENALDFLFSAVRSTRAR